MLGDQVEDGMGETLAQHVGRQHFLRNIYTENRKGVDRFGDFAVQLVVLKRMLRRNVMYFGVVQNCAQRQPVASTIMKSPTP